MYLMSLLEVAKEISRQNVESTSKLFLAVNDKVFLQEEGTKEGTIQFASKIYWKNTRATGTVSSQKNFHQW